MSNNKHLTLDDRITIEKGLSNGACLKAIADTLNKDKSTILKEIKRHVKIVPRNIYGKLMIVLTLQIAVITLIAQKYVKISKR